MSHTQFIDKVGVAIMAQNLELKLHHAQNLTHVSNHNPCTTHYSIWMLIPDVTWNTLDIRIVYKDMSQNWRASHIQYLSNDSTHQHQDIPYYELAQLEYSFVVTLYIDRIVTPMYAIGIY